MPEPENHHRYACNMLFLLTKKRKRRNDQITVNIHSSADISGIA
jgi:hypothetical protein